jgi:hypothetical protein
MTFVAIVHPIEMDVCLFFDGRLSVYLSVFHCI